MKNFRIGSGLLVIFVILVISGIACTNYTIPGRDAGNGGSNTCEDCHTDYELLIQEHTPDDSDPLTGYGVVAPHYEPYDRVFMGGEGYDAYKESAHYSVGCKGCHNGDNQSSDKEVAHSADFIKHPSMFFEEKCATCHKEITDAFTTSIHQGTGMKRAVALRSGLSGPEEFDQLPAHQIEGYDNNCAHCHGSCGSCHVVRPPMGGGGLLAGHNFNKTPDTEDVCLTCHLSHGAHAVGDGTSGVQPDLHTDIEDFNCLSCHDKHELHGGGQTVEQRYAYSELPDCENCHQGIGSANNYHSMHYGDFNCQVCHSQDYNSCGNCHIGGEGARIQPYMDFKIAANPLPELREGFDLTLVRRTTAAPDNWQEYGVDEYPSFDVLPTYNYATPHNLLRWTNRTQVESGMTCNQNCHIRKEGDSLINKELYLFQADLLEWELDATGHLTVDDKLPSSWTK